MGRRSAEATNASCIRSSRGEIFLRTDAFVYPDDRVFLRGFEDCPTVEEVDECAVFAAAVFADEVFEAGFVAELFADFFELEDDADEGTEVSAEEEEEAVEDFPASDCAWTNVPHAKRPVRNIAKRNPNHRL